MRDATEWILGAFAVALGVAAFGIGLQVLREAWRGAFTRGALGRTASRAPWRTGLRSQSSKPDVAQEPSPPSGRRSGEQ